MGQSAKKKKTFSVSHYILNQYTPHFAAVLESTIISKFNNVSIATFMHLTTWLK
jgi:hypothetical protein